MKKKLKDITPGDNFAGVLLVKACHLLITKAGDYYLDLELVDSTGRIKAKHWKATRESAEELSNGTFAMFRGFVDTYRDELQLKLDSYKVMAESEIDITEFMPSSRFPVEDMLGYLRRTAASLQNEHIQRLWTTILDDSEIMTQFAKCPAAVSYHHVFLGGLLEHTCEVIRLGDAIAAIRPELDRDILLIGALLHDIGKIAEYSSGPAFVNLDEGLLLGHLYIGTEMIDRLISEIEDFPELLSATIKHLVLSHHGTKEFGSPVEPSFAEAVVLHYIDNIDAKVNNIRSTISEDIGDSAVFTTSQSKMLKRRMLKTTVKPEPEGYNPFKEPVAQVAVDKDDEAGDIEKPEAVDEPTLFRPPPHHGA